jgi:hypothetical protein
VYAWTGRTLYASATNIAFRRRCWSGYDVQLTQGGDELDLLRSLRQRGRIKYNHTNPTYTSSRRLTRGALYGFFVTLLVYYLLAYFLNRATGRRLIGSAPAYRNDRSLRSRRLQTSAIALIAVAIALMPFAHRPVAVLTTSWHSLLDHLTAVLTDRDS